MYIPSHQLDRLVDKIKSDPEFKEKVFLFFVGEKQAPDLEELVQTLDAQGITFFGGIFPEVIYKQNKYLEGLVVSSLYSDLKPVLITDLNQRINEFDALKKIKLNPSHKSAVVLVDGLTSNISGFLSKLYYLYGNSVDYIGGGAGSLSLEQMPCIFSNEGVFQDAALICFANQNISLGVKHGWQEVAGPFLANDTQNNIIKELNWRPALEVYQESILSHVSADFDKDLFFDTAKEFPFGISKSNSESIVRDPIALNADEHLICVGEVPENTALMILKGEKEYLVQAAREAAITCKKGNQHEAKGLLIFDCISRVLFLEQAFQEELDAISQEIPDHLDAMGALTLGEIATAQNGYIEFYNKTIVLGMLEEKILA